MTAVVTLLCIVCAALTLFVVGLLRSHAEILKALHELGVNVEEGTSADRQVFDLREPVPSTGLLSVAPDLRGQTPTGDAVNIGVGMGPQATLLAFLSSGCGVCAEFWEQLRAGEQLSGELDARIVAVTRGVDQESPGKVDQLAGGEVLTLMSNDAYEDYQVPVAPYFVLIAASGRVIGEGAAKSWSQLGGLLDRAVADGAAPSTATPNRRDILQGRLRRQSADEALASAGVQPGDASLFQDPTA